MRRLLLLVALVLALPGSARANADYDRGVHDAYRKVARVQLTAALDEIQRCWNQVRTFDRARNRAATELRDAIRHQIPMADDHVSVKLQSATFQATYFTRIPNDVWKYGAILSAYDIDQIRANKALVRSSKLTYHTPGMLAWGGLSSLQSRIEGAESAANGKRSEFNRLSQQYNRMASTWPGKLVAGRPGIPASIGAFSVYSDGQTQDVGEECADDDGDGDCHPAPAKDDDQDR